MQVNHLSNSLPDGKQVSIDGFGPLKGAHIDNQIDQGVQVGNGSTIANPGTLNAEFLGLAIDAFASGTLGVDRVIERRSAIQHHAQASASFPVEIFVAAQTMIAR